MDHGPFPSPPLLQFPSWIPILSTSTLVASSLKVKIISPIPFPGKLASSTPIGKNPSGVNWDLTKDRRDDFGGRLASVGALSEATQGSARSGAEERSSEKFSEPLPSSTISTDTFGGSSANVATHSGPARSSHPCNGLCTPSEWLSLPGTLAAWWARDPWLFAFYCASAIGFAWLCQTIWYKVLRKWHLTRAVSTCLWCQDWLPPRTRKDGDSREHRADPGWTASQPPAYSLRQVQVDWTTTSGIPVVYAVSVPRVPQLEEESREDLALQ